MNQVRRVGSGGVGTGTDCLVAQVLIWVGQVRREGSIAGRIVAGGTGRCWLVDGGSGCLGWYGTRIVDRIVRRPRSWQDAAPYHYSVSAFFAAAAAFFATGLARGTDRTASHRVMVYRPYPWLRLAPRPCCSPVNQIIAQSFSENS